MNVIILHGNKLSPLGQLSMDMQYRLKAVRSLLTKKSYDLLVITGGRTRKKYDSEADCIFKFVDKTFNIKTLLENQSKTTRENILNTKELLKSLSIDSVTVVTSKNSFRRFKRLYKLYLPEYKDILNFELAENFNGFSNFIKEVLLYVSSLIDPKERLIRPFIKVFRS